MYSRGRVGQLQIAPQQSNLVLESTERKSMWSRADRERFNEMTGDSDSKRKWKHNAGPKRTRLQSKQGFRRVAQRKLYLGCFTDLDTGQLLMCVTSIFLRNGPLWSREERAVRREREKETDKHQPARSLSDSQQREGYILPGVAQQL